MTRREQDVLEFVQLGGASRVDREKGVIYGAKILGAKSKNGGRYPRAAREAAKAKYEGIVINVNHPRRDKPGDERKVEERFGVASNIQITDDGTYADVAYLKSHPMADSVAEAAERKELSNIFGFSHNAVTVQSDQDGEVVHESISKVRSVDLVADPATTKGVFESMKPVLEADGEFVRAAGGDAALAQFLGLAASIWRGDESPEKKANVIRDAALERLKDGPKRDGKEPPDDPVVRPQVADATESARRRSLYDDPRLAAGCLTGRKVLFGAPRSVAPRSAGGQSAGRQGVETAVLEGGKSKSDKSKWDDPKAATAALLGRG